MAFKNCVAAAGGEIDGVMGYFGLKESNRLSLCRRIHIFFCILGSRGLKLEFRSQDL